MSRGKHGRAAARRRERDAQDRLGQLRSERDTLAAQVDALDERAAAARADREKLTALRDERDRRVAGDLARLEAMLVEYRAAVDDEEALTEVVSEAFDEAVGLLVRSFGGGVSGLERTFRKMGIMGDRSTYRGSVANDHLSSAAVRRIQVARGMRDVDDLHDYEPPSPDELLDALPGPVRAHVDRDPALRKRADNLFQRLYRSTPFHTDRNTVHMWAAVAMGTDPASPEGLYSTLWSGTADDPQVWLDARPSTDALARRIAGKDPAVARAASHERISSPWTPQPLFPRPVDAVSLRWWYWLAASMAEVNVEDVADRRSGDGVSVDDAFAGIWPDPATTAGALYRDIADSFDGAVPFWLPPGRTAAFLDSDAPPAQDLQDARLPYRHVLVTFAEPLSIPGTGGTSPLHTMLSLDPSELAEADVTYQVRRAANDTVTWADVHSSIATDLDYVAMVDRSGLHVEGVLFEADGAGRRTDRVVWCVAAPTAQGDAYHWRAVVPAFASRSPWASVLDRLFAVVAWGGWAGRDLDELDSDDRSRNRSRHGSGDVRVLPTRRRSRLEVGSSEPSGRTVVPHLRRGHWRRQHHGTAGRDVKLVYIEPTLVNATRGALTPQVYRLQVPED